MGDPNFVPATPDTQTKTGGEMSQNILRTLRAEHQQARSLLERIPDQQDPARKKELYLLLREELVLHMKGEEKTLYAHLAHDTHDSKAEELAQQADREHEGIKSLLSQIDNTGIEQAEWAMLFDKLKTRLIHHIEAEEKTIFSEAKEDFTHEELKEIGDEFEELKPLLDLN